MAHRGYTSTRWQRSSTITKRASAHDIARLAGLQPNRQGFISCPLHADNSPSLHLLQRGYRCFSCGSKGGLLDLTIALGVAPDRASAARWLDERVAHE